MSCGARFPFAPFAAVQEMNIQRVAIEMVFCSLTGGGFCTGSMMGQRLRAVQALEELRKRFGLVGRPRVLG